MIESELKIRSVEKEENSLEKRKKKFFSGLKQRLLALAAAGFLTLGAGWARDILSQIDVDEKEVKKIELVMSGEISEVGLERFKNRIKEEEPDFAKLVEKHRRDLTAQLKIIEEGVRGEDIQNLNHLGDDQKMLDQEIADYESGSEVQGNISQTITTDHKLISELKSNPDFLRVNNGYIIENFDDIFWSFAFLNDYKPSRNALIGIKPPKIYFKSHAPYGQPARANAQSVRDGTRWQPNINLYPLAFIGPDGRLNANTYINIFIHEFAHSSLSGTEDGKQMERKMGNDFAGALDEGRVQSITYKTVRYLNRDNPDLKPVFKEFDGYDRFLVISELVESIAKTHSNSSFLIDWQLGVIDYETMLAKLNESFINLGLGDKVSNKLVSEFRFGGNKDRVSDEFLTDLLARLKLSAKVKLSEDFVRSIIKSNARY